MTLEQAKELLDEEYERAKGLKWVRKPLDYALHQVWKKADKKERKNERTPKYTLENRGYQDFLLTILLGKYIRDELDEITRFNIRVAAEEIALDDWLVYVTEIAYHIGYAYSLLNEKISETTYKKMKGLVKDHLIIRLSEEG